MSTPRKHEVTGVRIMKIESCWHVALIVDNGREFLVTKEHFPGGEHSAATAGARALRNLDAGIIRKSLTRWDRDELGFYFSATKRSLREDYGLFI